MAFMNWIASSKPYLWKPSGAMSHGEKLSSAIAGKWSSGFGWLTRKPAEQEGGNETRSEEREKRRDQGDGVWEIRSEDSRYLAGARGANLLVVMRCSMGTFLREENICEGERVDEGKRGRRREKVDAGVRHSLRRLGPQKVGVKVK